MEEYYRQNSNRRDSRNSRGKVRRVSRLGGKKPTLISVNDGHGFIEEPELNYFPNECEDSYFMSAYSNRKIIEEAYENIEALKSPKSKPSKEKVFTFGIAVNQVEEDENRGSGRSYKSSRFSEDITRSIHQISCQNIQEDLEAFQLRRDSFSREQVSKSMDLESETSIAFPFQNSEILSRKLMGKCNNTLFDTDHSSPQVSIEKTKEIQILPREEDSVPLRSSDKKAKFEHLIIEIEDPEAVPEDEEPFSKTNRSRNDASNQVFNSGISFQSPVTPRSINFGKGMGF